MEFEFKLQVPFGSVAAVESELQAEGVERVALQARYFDTADGALARHGMALRLRRECHGMALRLRRENDRLVQTLKAPGRRALEREEHEVELGPADTTQALAPDPSRHAGTPAGERLQALLADAGNASGPAVLEEIHATDIVRLRREVEAAGSRVEIALDRGTVSAGTGEQRRVDAVCELELELLHGPAAPLADLAAAWCRRHGLWISTLSKSARGARLRQALHGHAG